MHNRDISIGKDYAHAIFNRVSEPLPPFDFKPDWSDRPSFYKFYQDVERIALPFDFPTQLITMADVLARLSTSPAEKDVARLSFDDLAAILYYAHGVLARRLRINWNIAPRTLAIYDLYNHNEARGTASGGGLYPTEIYWACGSSGPLLPGLYHYDNAHHAVERLCTGDMTGQIQEALFAYPDALQTDQFLLISLNIWKNAFKYNNFGYHVITQDLGALLYSLRCLAAGFDSELQPLFWYQEKGLTQLLGLDIDDESVFAIVPLPLGSSAPAPVLHDKKRPSRSEHDLRVQKTYWQRSQVLQTFDLHQGMHAAAMIDDEPRPQRQEAYKASPDNITWGSEQFLLPPPDMARLQADLLTTMKQRCSSFGNFSSHQPLALEELSLLLAFGASACNYTSDLKMPDGSPHLTRQIVFVNHVQGLERGFYAYDRQDHSLWTIHNKDLRLFLQENYFLQNYNLAEIGALIAVVGSVDKILEVYGNRGYRVLNAEVGMVAQSIYMAASALSCGCGAALGFNNMALNEAAGLTGTDDRAILIVIVGHERQHVGNFDYRLV